jgi:hypothetical protein
MHEERRADDCAERRRDVVGDPDGGAVEHGMTIVFSSRGMLIAAWKSNRTETIQEQGNDESQTDQGQQLIGTVGAVGSHQGLRQKNEEGDRDDGAGTETARQMPAVPHAPRKSGTGQVGQIRDAHDDDELNELHVSLSNTGDAIMRQRCGGHRRSASPFLNRLRNAEE